MKKTAPWLFELAIIIFIISISLQIRLAIGVGNFPYFFAGYLVSIAVMSLFLLYALFRIKKRDKEKILPFHSYFKKMHLKDIGIIIFIHLSGNLAYVGLTRIDLLESVGIDNVGIPFTFSTLQLTVTICVMIFYVIIVVLSEEFYFRAYLFNKQFPVYRGSTWFVNGFSWSLYHIFTPTNFIALLPLCLMFSYAYQKSRNLWITIIAHLLQNIIVYHTIIKSFTIKI
jgi:membrane protease YdiL (CAAX protease family)